MPNKIDYGRLKNKSKFSVRVASVQAEVLANVVNGYTMDGIVLATNDRVLLKNQAIGTQNGVYIVQAANPPVLADDYELLVGYTCYVTLGTVNNASIWSIITIAALAPQFSNLTNFVSVVTTANIVEGTRAQFFAYRTTSFDMAATNTWYDYPWNVAAVVKKNFTHNNGVNPEQITVLNAGTYKINWRLDSATAAAHQFVTRLLLDGVEIVGSYASGYVTGNNMNHSLTSSILKPITANQILKVQVGTNIAGSDIAYFDDINMPDPTTFVAASITIDKISND